MEKDNNYWNLHKEVYLEHFSELSSEIRDLITNNPNSKEAKLLNFRVDTQIKNTLSARQTECV